MALEVSDPHASTSSAQSNQCWSSQLPTTYQSVLSTPAPRWFPNPLISSIVVSVLCVPWSFSQLVRSVHSGCSLNEHQEWWFGGIWLVVLSVVLMDDWRVQCETYADIQTISEKEHDTWVTIQSVLARVWNLFSHNQSHISTHRILWSRPDCMQSALLYALTRSPWWSHNHVINHVRKGWIKRNGRFCIKTCHSSSRLFPR